MAMSISILIFFKSVDISTIDIDISNRANVGPEYGLGGCMEALMFLEAWQSVYIYTGLNAFAEILHMHIIEVLTGPL